jgi:hypothetical protein
VQLLAKLGGWVPHKDRRPGKITLIRGLRRLLDMLATQAIQSYAAAQQGGLPLAISPFCKLETSSTGAMTGCQSNYRQYCLPPLHQPLYWQRRVPLQVGQSLAVDELAVPAFVEQSPTLLE